MQTSKLKLVTGVLFTLWLHAAAGAISEPDNLIYGSITLDNIPVSAARTDVVIEARRTLTGAAIASYRMGANPALGDFYALTLPLESVAPVTNNVATQVGETIFITVVEGVNVRGQTGFLIAERGAVERIDFGAIVTDGDGDGLPDTWELVHFSGLGRSTNSPTANGQTVLQHYLAGTDPNDPNDGFRLQLVESNAIKRVSFQTRVAQGPGYEGLVRQYTLETETNPAGAAWTGVSGFINVPGTNQLVVYQTTGSSGAAFFRGKISLMPATVGVLTNDLDGDGLPDPWETQYFGNLNATAASLTLNGQTALQNYVAGTNPTNATSVFKVSLTSSGNTQTVAFATLPTQGLGYEGRQRYYTLESSPTPTGPWQAVPGRSTILGAGQTVTYQATAPAAPLFFRGRVWLQ